MSSINTDANALLSKGVTVKYQGKTLEIPRLGLAQVNDLANVLEGVATLSVAGAGLFSGKADNDAMVALLIQGYQKATGPFVTFVCNLIGEDPNTFVQGAHYPLPFVMEIIKAIATHPDVTDFFGAMSGLLQLDGPVAETIKNLTTDQPTPEAQA